MTWRETRRVAKSLTVQYDRVMCLVLHSRYGFHTIQSNTSNPIQTLKRPRHRTCRA
jgi:hypothetical protein